jgi:hypothetical protein
MTDIDALVAYAKRELTSYPQLSRAETNALITALTTERAKVVALEAENAKLKADFDAAGNYIPHSQIDGDLRATKAEAARWRKVAGELAGALTPFQPAYEAFVRHVQTASVKGETGFERRASSGEIGDRAFELAFDEMTSITFDQLHAVDAALARFKQESGQ